MRRTLAFALTLGLTAAAHADSTTIDFTSLAPGTAVTNQYAGVTFSISGGDAYGTVPVIGGFYTPFGLTNTPNGNYPTDEFLNAAFTTAQSSVSFTFDNYGDNYFAPTTVYAYNASDALVASEDLEFAGNASLNFDPYTIAGAGITELVFDNGSGGNYDWQFAVGSITYDTSAVTPEPASLVMLGTGLFGMGAELVRRRRSS